MMPKFHQLYDGDAFTLTKRQGLKLACCDCGKVHRIVIETTKRGYRVTIAQDKRSTGQTRRQMKQKQGVVGKSTHGICKTI